MAAAVFLEINWRCTL